MRVTTKQAITSYTLQKNLGSSPSDSQRERERLQRHIKKTRDVLIGDSGEESFASILHDVTSVGRH